MKKLFFMFVMLFAFSVTTQAQSKPSVYGVPYASLNDNVMSYGVEAGLAYKRVWTSLSYTYTPDGYGNYLTAALYNKIVKVSKANLWLYNSLTMDVDTKYLVYAPGATVFYDLTPSISPILTVSIPVVKSTTLSYTLGIMYTF